MEYRSKAREGEGKGFIARIKADVARSQLKNGQSSDTNWAQLVEFYTRHAEYSGAMAIKYRSAVGIPWTDVTPDSPELK